MTISGKSTTKFSTICLNNLLTTDSEAAASTDHLLVLVSLKRGAGPRPSLGLGSCPSGTASHLPHLKNFDGLDNEGLCASGWLRARPAYGFPPIRRGCRQECPWARGCSAGGRRNGSRDNVNKHASRCCACAPSRYHR